MSFLTILLFRNQFNFSTHVVVFSLVCQVQRDMSGIKYRFIPSEMKSKNQCVFSGTCLVKSTSLWPSDCSWPQAFRTNNICAAKSDYQSDEIR